MRTVDDILAPYTKIVELTDCNDSLTAVKKLTEDNLDIVHFLQRTTFGVNNHAILQKNANGMYCHRYVVPRDADMMSEITADVPFQLFVGNQPIENSSRCVVIAASYMEISIEFTLDPSNLPKEYTVQYRQYILKDDIRRALCVESPLVDGMLRYSGGLLRPCQ